METCDLLVGLNYFFSWEYFGYETVEIILELCYFGAFIMIAFLLDFIAEALFFPYLIVH